jgi:hypothetical protein
VNALEGDKTNNNHSQYCGEKSKPKRMSKETNNEELFIPPKKSSKK